MDEFDDLEDEFEVEASRRMSFCDSCGTSVTAKMHFIIDGGELKYCYHHSTEYGVKLRTDGAFAYEIAA